MSARKKRAAPPGAHRATKERATGAPSTPTEGTSSTSPQATNHRWLSAWALGPIAAVRPYLAMRVVLWILAIDVWSTHLGAAWRYGTAGFNVAHFAWMDALLPIPSAVTYVGMLALVSAGAAIAASMAHPPRLLVVGVALLYLWGWSSSMHDSYQHHYLLSWVLLSFAFVPWHGADELLGPPSRGRMAESTHWLSAAGFATLPHGPIPRTHAWGYRLVTLLPAVVYAYTAVSKLEPEWRSGDALRSLTNGGEGLEPMLSALASLGVTGDEAWPFLGATTIAIQITVALAYLFAPLMDLDIDRAPDAHRGRVIGVLLGASLVLAVGGAALFAALGHPVLSAPLLLGSAGLFTGWRMSQTAPVPRTALVAGVARGLGMMGAIAAIAFHIGAEHMGLEIGWFSYYMIALAIAVLGPPTLLGGLVAVITAIPREAEVALRAKDLPPVAGLGLAIGGVMALAALGDLARVPGAFPALLLAGGGVLCLGIVSLMRSELRRASIEVSIGAIALALLASTSLSRTEQRFDYFRFAGGDFRRRGELVEALASYREAVVLAPTDEERERIEGRIAELEALTD